MYNYIIYDGCEIVAKTYTLAEARLICEKQGNGKYHILSYK